MRRDSASGDGYAVAIINKDGFKELSAEETLERANKMKLLVGFAKHDLNPFQILLVNANQQV